MDLRILISIISLTVSFVAKLVRTLMYAGFEMGYPGVLPRADPKYLVLGMDL